MTTPNNFGIDRTVRSYNRLLRCSKLVVKREGPPIHVGSRMNIMIAKPQRDGRREAILAIAREVFMREGYAATSMSMIAAKVGGSKGTLYNHFRSKADLFVAVIQHQCDINQAELFDVPSTDLRTYLTLLAGRFARLMLSEDILAMHRIVVAEAIRFPEIGQALYAAGLQRGKARMIEYFDNAVSKGVMRPCDTGVAAEQAMELTLAGLYRRRLWNVGPPPSEEEIDLNVKAGVETFMAAFGV